MDASSQHVASGQGSAARRSFSSKNSSSPRRIPQAIADSLSNALCASIIAYCVLSLIAGQAGFLAYREVKADIARMELQLKAFSMENAALSESKEALVSDRDRIAREARSIGYIRTDEKIIQLTNVDTTLASPRAGTARADSLRPFQRPARRHYKIALAFNRGSGTPGFACNGLSPPGKDRRPQARIRKSPARKPGGPEP
jgi:Septum formation initiator